MTTYETSQWISSVQPDYYSLIRQEIAYDRVSGNACQCICVGVANEIHWSFVSFVHTPTQVFF